MELTITESWSPTVTSSPAGYGGGYGDAPGDGDGYDNGGGYYGTSTSTFTSITSNSNEQISTIVSISIVTAPADSPTDAITAIPSSTTNSPSSSSSPTSTIIGTTVAVPLGLIALGLLTYFLRRHRKREALYCPAANTDVFLPPNVTYGADDKSFSKVELDTQPNALVELHSNNVPIELEGSPTAVPHPSDRISVMSTPRNNRHSSTSSLTPMATCLQAVSQQRYGSDQSSYLIPSHPYRLSRHASGLLPTIEVSGTESLWPPKPSSVSSSNQGTNALQSEQPQVGQGDEKVRTVQKAEDSLETNEKKDKTAPASDNAMASVEAQVDEKVDQGQEVHGSENAHDSPKLEHAQAKPKRTSTW